MDSAQLATFLAAAESGSFAAAAGMVNASASSVTERIAALEHRVGVSLFRRSRRGCTLSEAGERFLPRAQAIMATWELARDEAALPARFTGQLRLGAQYALWPEFLIPWVASLQDERPDLALALSAGASARMNRQVGAGIVDLAVLYSPVLGAAVEAREVVNDRLVMVRSTALADWRDGWIDIDWGEEMRGPIAEAVGYRDAGGIALDLGGMALRWLIERGAAGYVPARLARKAIAEGLLAPVEELPGFDYPAYALWRRDTRLPVADIVDGLCGYVRSTESLDAPGRGMDGGARPL